MKPLLIILGVIAVWVSTSLAQPQIDSIQMNVTGLWVNSVAVSQGGSSDTSYAINFSEPLSVPVDNEYRGDTIIVYTRPSPTSFFHYSFLIVFNEDTTIGHVWTSGGYLGTRELNVLGARVTNTPRFYEIDLDSAALDAVSFWYKTYEDHGGHGGYKFFKMETSSGTLLPTTRITFRFFKRGSLGVDNSPAFAVSMHPNPVREKLIVSMPNDVPSELTIYDLVGRLVFTSFLHGSGEVDISHLRPGTYVANIAGEAHKIIIH